MAYLHRLAATPATHAQTTATARELAAADTAAESPQATRRTAAAAPPRPAPRRA
jgi:hypothetical protein